MKNTYSQEYLAQINQNIDSCVFTINSEKLEYIYKNDTFLTYKFNDDVIYWPIWTKNGNYGSLPKYMIKLISDSINFKIITNVEKLQEAACHKHTTDNFNLISVNYCELIKRIINKDYEALSMFFCLTDKLEGALAETHSADSWDIFNYFSDKEFYHFLKSQDVGDQINISQYLTQPNVTYPITKIKDYFIRFYPLTWTIVERYGCVK
jgi:hypothetical protein